MPAESLRSPGKYVSTENALVLRKYADVSSVVLKRKACQRSPLYVPTEPSMCSVQSCSGSAKAVALQMDCCSV